MKRLLPFLMDSGALTYTPEIYAEKLIDGNHQQRVVPVKSRISRLFEELSETAREDLISFLVQRGLTTGSQMLVIPSTHHFFYDAEDLKGVKTVINLKQLNHIRDMKGFLKTIAELLPQRSNFVGCFTDNKARSGFSDKYNNIPGYHTDKADAFENGIESRIPFINRMYSLMDLRTNRYLTKRIVTSLLVGFGFRVEGMTELNGMTYFYTRKIYPAA